MKNPAVSGGASVDQAGWLDKPKCTAKSQHKQDQRRWRGALRRLAAAARAGLLAGRETEIVISLDRQSVPRGWRPSPRQTALLWRIAASLGEPDEALIDADDPVTAADLFKGGRYE